MSNSTDAFRVGEQRVGPDGQFSHPQLLDHSERLKEEFYQVGEHLDSRLLVARPAEKIRNLRSSKKSRRRYGARRNYSP